MYNFLLFPCCSLGLTSAVRRNNNNNSVPSTHIRSSLPSVLRTCPRTMPPLPPHLVVAASIAQTLARWPTAVSTVTSATTATFRLSPSSRRRPRRRNCGGGFGRSCGTFESLASRTSTSSWPGSTANSPALSALRISDSPSYAERYVHACSVRYFSFPTWLAHWVNWQKIESLL